jgi:cyanate permease
MSEKSPHMIVGTGDDIRTSSRYRFVIAGLVFAAHLSMGLNLFPISPLVPIIIKDFEINNTLAGLLGGLPLLVRAFMGLPGSVVINRFGLNRIFTVSWFLIGCLVLSSIAPSFLCLLFLRIVYGVGAGLLRPATGPLIMQWFGPGERHIINSLDVAIVTFGMAASVSIGAPLAEVIGWRNVLGLFGGIGLMGAIAWSRLSPTQIATEDARRDFVLRELWSVLRDRTIVLIIVGDSLVFIQYAALTSWLPTFFHEWRGMSLEQAGYLTGLLPFVGIISVLVGGFLARKVEAKRLFFIVPGILVGLGGFGSFLTGKTATISASVIVLGVGTWIYQPMFLTLPMELPWMTPRKMTVVWGTHLTVTGFGMFLSPIIVGASRDLFGTFVPGFLFFAVLAWALFFTGILLPKR